MAEQLPDEIWLKILSYTSLEDRIRNIQFCCKRFHRLCDDYALTRNLDFSKAVFLPEDLCLDAVNKAREYVSRLSFKGCHWLNSSLFMDLPHLPALETLNIVCCLLDVDQILSLLQKVPKLKNLAFSLDVDKMDGFIHDMYYSKHHSPGDLRLQRLHVHFYGKETYIDICGGGGHSPFTWLYSAFHIDETAECLSVEINDSHNLDDSAKISATVADFSRRTCDSAFRYDHDCLDFCSFTKVYGLHKRPNPVDSESDLPLLDLSQLTYLRLPEFRYDMISDLNVRCNGVLPPEGLPNLEYLLCCCNFTSTCSFECYDKLTNGIILDCQLPNLKYLHFTAWENPPMEFYTRVENMKKLIELDLSGPFDLNLLLESIESLCRLESFTFAFGEEHDSRAFLEGIAIAAPRLRKLKVTLPKGGKISHILYPIHKLEHLESLDIFSCCELGDANVFCDVLKKLHRLTSLTFYVRGKKKYNFSKIIQKALKFLPNLVQLTLSSKESLPTEDVLKAVKECKKLEKLWIEELNTVNLFMNTSMSPLLEEVITSLPRLHLMAVFTRRFPKNVMKDVTKLLKGRKIVLYCAKDCDDSIPDILRPLHPCPNTWPVLPLDCF